FVRASVAHARVRGVDASAALGLSGVHAVFTAADMNSAMQTMRLPMLVPNPYYKISLTQYALAQGEVCYVGEPIAVVVADSRHLAEDASALVAVDYDHLPAVSDCRDAVKTGAVPAHRGAP